MSTCGHQPTMKLPVSMAKPCPTTKSASVTHFTSSPEGSAATRQTFGSPKVFGPRAMKTWLTSTVARSRISGATKPVADSTSKSGGLIGASTRSKILNPGTPRSGCSCRVLTSCSEDARTPRPKPRKPPTSRAAKATSPAIRHDKRPRSAAPSRTRSSGESSGPSDVASVCSSTGSTCSGRVTVLVANSDSSSASRSRSSEVPSGSTRGAATGLVRLPGRRSVPDPSYGEHTIGHPDPRRPVRSRSRSPPCCTFVRCPPARSTPKELVIGRREPSPRARG